MSYDLAPHSWVSSHLILLLKGTTRIFLLLIFSKFGSFCLNEIWRVWKEATGELEVQGGMLQLDTTQFILHLLFVSLKHCFALKPLSAATLCVLKELVNWSPCILCSSRMTPCRSSVQCPVSSVQCPVSSVRGRTGYCLHPSRDQQRSLYFHFCYGFFKRTKTNNI